MSTSIQKADDSQAEAIERVLITGDLGKLTPEQRVSYYASVCHSVGLNKLTNPFAYIKLNGKLVLYALKGCTDQLRSVNGISIEIVDRSQIGDIYTVTARATCKGRTDEDEGSVSTKGLYGEALANQHMKALTKAKRRVTLSLVGLGMLDESEAQTIPGAVMTPASFAAHPEGNGGSYREEDGSPDGKNTLDFWAKEVSAWDSAEAVRNCLAEARDFLGTEDYEELQMHASEHIDFLGGE